MRSLTWRIFPKVFGFRILGPLSMHNAASLPTMRHTHAASGHTSRSEPHVRSGDVKVKIYHELCFEVRRVYFSIVFY